MRKSDAPDPVQTIAPPAHVAPYVRALGQAGAVRFFRTFGGAALYLARSPQERGRLAQQIGANGVARLVAELGEDRLGRVPQPKQWIARVMRAEGTSVSEIARQMATTDKTVRQWLRAPAAAEGEAPKARQMSLFGE